jgi:hypothetical protein
MYIKNKMEDESIKECEQCKIVKSKSLFFNNKFCKRCHIKDYLEYHLVKSRIANYLNLSINEIDNILKIDYNDPDRNGLGEHYRYSEVMLLLTGWSMLPSTVITDEVINKFLDE